MPQGKYYYTILGGKYGLKEKLIVAHIFQYLKTVPDCFAWKEHGDMYGTAGLPDIICCYHGLFVAFEVKAPSGKLTKLQEVTIQKIKDAKGKAYKVTSVEETKKILQSLEVIPDDDSMGIS